ncbi:uncharacterized protein At1g21580 [Lactuca sativa]|uniref:uncharacterized protein At1g21580 n=1 Tax=Lactuca sativa TaxID=4236 RepID=UPI000CD95EFC|nr:uncharacterized protein At1g21580 [Lactuca sativa]
MEFPSFNHHHHHNRYVPPPPPTNFSDDRPNLYPHHQQHLLPSLHLPPPPPLAYPSLPPPPPPPLPVPPPPPSYNPHQSHFTFLDAQNPSFSNHGRSSPPQPRFSNQSHRFDYRTDSWSDSHRVPPELTHRNPILPDEHHRRLYSPDPRSENHYKPHVSERVIPSSRYRDENIINGYASRDASNIVSQEQQAFRGSSNNDDHQGRIIDRYASAQATGCNSRNEDFVEKYEPRYISNSENERIWDHHGEDSRRKGKKNEFGNNDGVLFVSGREQARDYEYESSRLTRVREGREEFKQVQKRSVLLRIGKPNNTNRNRSHDQHFSKAHMVESNNSNFRGKDKDRDHANKDSDHRMEGDREHSPVELDVSFKSNALVAKAVVTPSSPVIGNNNTQLRNKKTKRGSEFNSPLKRSGSSSNGLDCPSSSEKAPKQQKLSLKDPVLGQGAATGPLSFRLKKKRKLINFKNSPSVSIFQLAEKDNKSVKGQNKNSPSAESTPSTLEEPISSKVVSEKDSSEVEKLVSKIDDGLVNEVSLNLENDTQQVSTDAKVGTPISASCGQDQIEIQNCPTESYASFDAFSAVKNESFKIQEMTTCACSDEIINLVPENGNTVGFLDGVSRKKDGTQETPNANAIAIAEDNAILTGRSYEASEIQSHGENLQNVGPGPTPNSSIKVISSDEDEIVEIVELNSESVETQRPDHREEDEIVEIVELNFESQKPEDEVVGIVELNSESTETQRLDHRELCTDEIPPASSIVCRQPDEKPGEPMPDMLTNIVSGFPKDETTSTSNSNLGNNDVNICEKFVPEPEDGGGNTSVENYSKTSSIIKPSDLSGTKTTTSQVLNKKMPIKRPNPTVFATRSSPVFTNSRVNNPSKSIAKPPRTWHRSVNNTSSVPRPTKQVGAVQNAYIRSGNTLVRKGSPVTTISRSSIYQLNPSGPSPTETRTAAVVRPKTPPLSGYTATKLPDSTTLKVSPLEDQNCSESHKSLDEGGTAGKKIEYVKPKSNQLVAATSSVQELDKSSDGYYKRRKNQLIRTLVADDSVPDVRKAAKGMFKKYRNSRFSSVWTLGAQSLGKDGVSLRQKLRPHLFPWKRTKFWGNASASMHSNNLSSLLSRKLLVSRKREMIYTRSKHGFSLRMSKLLSVGGSGLKWSKSIEKNSKQANEEATLAVAAAEKKRREQQHLKRDRIFRIGLVRYKMDPSRRTLQRISDEEPSTSKSSKEEMRRSYVPKRLLIGHDEYLRIGNGNQLVRNPKRRTRLFANEKVRWSLHTARSRLARKKKYCQFFTRFGKCNKDNDGKCPYIHDSSKIAVCTKFLKGLCSNPHCNLTHKVIPERMQDCSYFLQGLCSNEHCPYRHVNVNSAASVCEAFLKGYCADGNECRKKHTYACPAFEATGECSQGTNCKLHHPKNRSTGGLKRKHQNQKTQKHSRGRYFGTVGGGGGGGEEAERQHHFNLKDILCQEGKLGADYISIDFGDGVTDETTTVVTSEEDPLLLVGEEEEEAHLDLDHLTKPIGIMKNFNLHTSHMA